MLGRWRSLTALCVWTRCGCAGQMVISCVCGSVSVFWADGDLSLPWCGSGVGMLGRWRPLSLPCVCGSVPVFWADEDLSLLCGCGSGVGVLSGGAGENRNPTCKCGNTSKVAQVKKEGPNKGRFFYACSGPREKQCKVGSDENVCVWWLFSIRNQKCDEEQAFLCMKNFIVSEN